MACDPRDQGLVDRIRAAVKKECSACEYGQEPTVGCTWRRDTGNTEISIAVRPPCLLKIEDVT